MKPKQLDLKFKDIEIPNGVEAEFEMIVRGLTESMKEVDTKEEAFDIVFSLLEEFRNELLDEIKHGRMLRDKGIAYAPDFLINAGGIINVYAEVAKYGRDEIMKQTENIYNTTLDIFKLSDEKQITTHQAAFDIAQARIDAKKVNNKS